MTINCVVFCMIVIMYRVCQKYHSGFNWCVEQDLKHIIEPQTSFTLILEYVELVTFKGFILVILPQTTEDEE